MTPQAKPAFAIGNRMLGTDYPPLVIAEIGINHEGDFGKAVQMVDDAARPAFMDHALVYLNLVKGELFTSNPNDQF